MCHSPIIINPAFESRIFVPRTFEPRTFTSRTFVPRSASSSYSFFPVFRSERNIRGKQKEIQARSPQNAASQDYATRRLSNHTKYHRRPPSKPPRHQLFEHPRFHSHPTVYRRKKRRRRQVTRRRVPVARRKEVVTLLYMLTRRRVRMDRRGERQVQGGILSAYQDCYDRTLSMGRTGTSYSPWFIH